MGKIDWATVLGQAGGQAGCTAVRLCKNGEYIEGYVHAIPLPDEAAARARHRAREASKKKGCTVRATPLLLAGWVLVFSTLPPELLGTGTVGQLYRVRWQVELVIKRLKSLLDVDRLRAHEGSLLAALYLHGKLLYAAVVEKRARQRFGMPGIELDRERTHTPWRPWVLITQEVRAMLNSAGQWNPHQAQGCAKTLQERPRRRKLQTLPSPVQRLVQQCREQGMSNV